MSQFEQVSVRRRFQRSIRLDTDLNDIKALHGFICPPTYASALETLSKQASETGHGAFTWTGPFGGGKSSLAVVLTALLSPPGSLRKSALQITGDTGKRVVQALKPGRTGYRALAVVGRKQDCAEQLAEALRRDGLIRREIETKDDGGKALLDAVQKIAARPKNTGLLLILDELGKVLEAAAQGRADLHFLQELAELASRSKGRLIVVGILHQAFGEYTGKLAQRTRNEWMKVQGRFVDVPLATVADEQLALLAEAIDSTAPKSATTSCQQLAAILAESRSVSHVSMADRLTACWPLNGITASLLGPFSRRRFGQNQRSIFSFLNSAEPLGFQSFLASAEIRQTYDPATLWNYLKANLEPSILASPDGHRWSTAVEAIERCEARGGKSEHQRVAKSIAIIDLFRDHAGFQATKKILKFAVPDVTPRRQANVLKDLERWSVIAFRRHLNAFSIHAGSDFDIEAAITEERGANISLALGELKKFADVKPIIAKRHYHQTGALRWVNFEILHISDVESLAKRPDSSDGSMGAFVVVVPSAEISDKQSTDLLKVASQSSFPSLTLGLLPNSEEIVDLAEELVALERLQRTRSELSGDAVARREVVAHLDATRQILSTKLHEAILCMDWFGAGKLLKLYGLAGIHSYVSDIADKIFFESPIIRNELLNRSKPSGTAVAARRALLHVMVKHKGEERLGIQGFPAEGGLFSSILDATEIYRQRTEMSPYPAFYEPPIKDAARLKPMWTISDRLIDQSADSPISLSDVYDAWIQPPYGAKEGLLPVLALAFILSRTDRIAIYLDGAFRPDIDDFVVDRLQQEPEAIQIRKMDFGKLRTRVLNGIADLVTEFDDDSDKARDPLVVSRRLVAIVTELPAWTLRTNTLSQDARRLREIIRSAADPHRFLFDDLPGFAAG